MVGIALIASWFVAVVFTPYLGVKLLPDFSAKHAMHDADIYNTRMYRIARRWLEACLRRPKTIVTATVVFFASTMMAFPMVKQQFFPQSSRPEVLIDIRLAEGSSFTATDAMVAEVESILAKDPEIKFYSSYIGGGPPRFFLSLDPDIPSPNFAKLVVMTAGRMSVSV